MVTKGACVPLLRTALRSPAQKMTVTPAVKPIIELTTKAIINDHGMVYDASLAFSAAHCQSCHDIWRFQGFWLTHVDGAVVPKQATTCRQDSDQCGSTGRYPSATIIEGQQYFLWVSNRRGNLKHDNESYPTRCMDHNHDSFERRELMREPRVETASCYKSPYSEDGGKPLAIRGSGIGMIEEYAVVDQVPNDYAAAGQISKPC